MLTATKQINSNWQLKPEVIKGNAGEDVIREFLESKGYVLYKPITEDKAHLIDFFGLTGDKRVFCFEVKTKRR